MLHRNVTYSRNRHPRHLPRTPHLCYLQNHAVALLEEVCSWKSTHDSLHSDRFPAKNTLFLFSLIFCLCGTGQWIYSKIDKMKIYQTQYEV